MLLDEAERAAIELGGEGNYQWTGFGPNNVLAHRVSVELALGNAGSAVEQFNRINLAEMPIIERKAVTHLDLANAYTQWGKYDDALDALRRAQQWAPQEMRRPKTKQMMHQIDQLANQRIRVQAFRLPHTGSCLMAFIGVVVCGAGPASGVGKLVQLLQEQGHDVRVIATPSAVPFLDIDALQAMTGHPVRSQHRRPDEPRSGERTEAYIVGPATFNTINKLSAGISDTYALDVINEAIGLKIPVVIMPFVNSALAARVPFRSAVADLEAEGATLVKTIGYHEPGQGGHRQESFPWHEALNQLGQSAR